MDGLRDVLEPLRPVVDGIHRGHHRQQHLRRADIRRGLVPADVLLAGLQREAVAGLAARVDGYTDEAARHLALQGIRASHEARVGSAESHRHAESLRRADADIRTELAGWLQQGECEQVRGDDVGDACTGVLCEEFREVIDAATGVRILDDGGEGALGRLEFLPIAHDHRDGERFGAGDDHVDRLGVAAVGNEDRGALRFPREGQAHRLGGGRAFVEQGGVGNVQPG